MLDSKWVHCAVIAVSKKLTASKAEKWETQSGKLFFKFSRARFHMEAIRASYGRIVLDQELAIPTGARTETFYSSYMGPMAEPLFFHLDAFFEAAKSAQDFTLACLGSADILRLSPNSLHKYCAKAFSNEASDIDRLLRDAWTDCGCKTKKYRDCLSHYVALSGHIWQTAINMKWSNGTWEIHLYLPDNPDARSYNAFTYKKRVDALSLCSSLFDATEKFFKAVISACLAKHGADPSTATGESFTLRNVAIGY